MSNIASLLKQEIARVARREVRSQTEKLKKASGAYRAQIAELKRQVTSLRQQIAQAAKANGQARPAAAPIPEASKVRFSSARLKKHRERLDLSAEKFARLFGVTGQTVYNWEAGTRPGMDHLLMIAKLRSLTKRQAQALVAERSGER